jgi:hypothetical protein
VKFRAVIKRIAFYQGNFFLLMFFFCSLQSLKAQNQVDFEEIEEFKIFLNIQDVSFQETDALFYDEHLYVSTFMLFQQLKIYSEVKDEFNEMRGYIDNMEDTFAIDYSAKKIRYKGVTDSLDDSKIIRNDYGLFLSTAELEKIFKITITFNFRTLSAYLSSKTNLPLIKILKREKIRKNLQNVKGEIKVDTTFGRKYHWLKGGVFDWKLNLAQTINHSESYQGRCALGMELFGGEFTAKLVKAANIPFDLYAQSVSWKFIKNENPVVKQIQLGSLSASPISTMNSSIMGAGISNVPSNFQKQYGTYHLFDKTMPNWEVELYVNDLLVDFKTADADGNFYFDVPLLYGDTHISLKFYGPWGEERSEEKKITIPRNFIPKNRVQYQLYNGFTFDENHYFYSGAKVSYGINHNISLGLGYEYFDKNVKSKFIPYAYISTRLFNKVLLNYSYYYNVKNALNLSIPLLKKLYIESNFSQFSKSQDAVITNDKYNISSGLSMPLKSGRWSAYNKLNYRFNQTQTLGFHYIDYYLSLSYKRISIVLSNATGLIKNSFTDNAGLSINYATPNQYIFNGQCQVNLKTGMVNSIRVDVQKKLFKKFFVDLNYTYSPPTRSSYLNFSLRFDLNFMQTSLSANVNQSNVTIGEDLFGSLFFSKRKPLVTPSSRSQISTCGIDVIVFLDVNHNGIKDMGESFLKNVNVNISQGTRVERGDSVYRFVALKPNTQYLLTIDNASLQNISWLAKYTTVAVYSDPDQIKTIFIPVEPLAEISGKVFYKKGNDTILIRNIIVDVFRKDGTFVKSVSSDEDGYFNYLGLLPGSYYLNVNATQAKNMNVNILQENIPFIIKMDRYGDYIENLDLYISRKDK